MVPEWAKRDEARKGLEEIFRAAYHARGVARWRAFLLISCVGFKSGLFSLSGAVKIMVLGCALNRSVTGLKAKSK